MPAAIPLPSLSGIHAAASTHQHGAEMAVEGVLQLHVRGAGDPEPGGAPRVRLGAPSYAHTSLASVQVTCMHSDMRTDRAGRIVPTRVLQTEDVRKADRTGVQTAAQPQSKSRRQGVGGRCPRSSSGCHSARRVCIVHAHIHVGTIVLLLPLLLVGGRRGMGRVGDGRGGLKQGGLQGISAPHARRHSESCAAASPPTHPAPAARPRRPPTCSSSHSATSSPLAAPAAGRAWPPRVRRPPAFSSASSSRASASSSGARTGWGVA